jgi:enamine deaminase RidA (YjgF/YER057c/UK114 family)
MSSSSSRDAVEVAAFASAALVLALAAWRGSRAAAAEQARRGAARPVHTDAAPAAIGPYSQAWRDGRGTVYVSGQVAFVPGTKTLDGTTAAQQAVRVLSNLRAILEAANSGMDMVLKTTVVSRSPSQRSPPTLSSAISCTN